MIKVGEGFKVIENNVHTFYNCIEVKGNVVVGEEQQFEFRVREFNFEDIITLNDKTEYELYISWLLEKYEGVLVREDFKPKDKRMYLEKVSSVITNEEFDRLMV